MDKIYKVMGERSFLLLLLFGVIIVAVGYFRPASPDPLKRNLWKSDRFWTYKTHCVWEADMIVAGNSRVYRGVSPEVLQKYLPGLKIFNFGYSSGGLNPFVYKEIDKRLNPRSTNRIILLGVDPHCLSDDAAKNGHILKELKRSREDIYSRVYFSEYLRWFEPLTIAQPRPKSLYFEEFHEDGFIGSWTEPANPRDYIQRWEKLILAGKYRCEKKLVDAMVAQIAAWTKSGVKVLAFRPPVPRDVWELEDRGLKFDTAEIIKKIEAAGGIWINTEPGAWATYDGSHLTKQEALRFSDYLGQEIKSRLTVPLSAPAKVCAVPPPAGR